MKEIYGEILERLGWSYTDDGDGNIELEKYSPAGEDFIVTVGAEKFVENVKEYAAHFDQEEHIEMWISARRRGTRGVPSTRELVKDAEGIDAMLKELAEALFAAELEAEGVQ